MDNDNAMKMAEEGDALTGVPRRTIVKGAAWSIPIIAAAVAVPAYAASGDKKLTFGPVSGCAAVGAQTSLTLTLANPAAGDTAVVSLVGTGYTFADGSTTMTVPVATGTATVVVKNVTGAGNVTVHAVLTGAPAVTADATVKPSCTGPGGTVFANVGDYDAAESVNGNLYVTGNYPTTAYMTVLNAATGAVVANWDIASQLRGPGAVSPGYSAQPYDVVASPDGTRVYVSYAGHGSMNGGFDNGVLILDAATGALIQRIETGGLGGDMHGGATAGRGLELSADGTRLTSLGGLSAKVIDTATGAILRDIPVPTVELSGTVSPDGATLYLPFGGDGNDVDVVDAATGTVIRTLVNVSIGQGTNAGHLAISPDGRTLYSHNGSTLMATDIATDTVVSTHTLPQFTGPAGPENFPQDIGISLDGTHAWVPYAGYFQNPKLIKVDL
ncbi:DNA-binding beta-propeller fold protein YncE [Microbacterium resistens]|uniref:DNA-binding beta-propeller fold protein YncE n=1 Tax=Microbacterium resistens TaxID=156977 RepID=A0ABU1S9W4_9MICO|nr:hypothetical protein [Microbacterium resistens]MDR6866398.1 DNA-binding beta-propeller fold protein YncE [Microbacterium resistens]